MRPARPSPARLCLAALALLAACGTPQEQCISRGSRDLRTLDRLIAETQGNLDRGFAYVEVRVPETIEYTCYEPGEPNPDGSPGAPVPSRCERHSFSIEQRAVAIDLNAERAKLASMRAKRPELVRAAEAAAAACRQAYPE